MSEAELFEEVYYSPRCNKIYVLLIAGNSVVHVIEERRGILYSCQWTPKLECELNQCIVLGEL